jgi:hypothetical protein
MHSFPNPMTAIAARKSFADLLAALAPIQPRQSKCIKQNRLRGIRARNEYLRSNPQASCRSTTFEFKKLVLYLYAGAPLARTAKLELPGLRAHLRRHAEEIRSPPAD